MVNALKTVSELSLNESYLKEVAVFIANKQQKYYSENSKYFHFIFAWFCWSNMEKYVI